MSEFKTDKIASLTKELEDEKARNAVLREDARELRKEKDLERKRNEDLTEEVTKAEGEVERLRSDVARLEEELAHLEEVDRATIDEREACRKERARFAAELDELGRFLAKNWPGRIFKTPAENAIELLGRMKAIVDQGEGKSQGIATEPEADGARATRELRKLRNYLFRDHPRARAAAFGEVGGGGKSSAELAIELLREKTGEGLAWAEEEVSKLSKYLLDEQVELLDDRLSPADNAIKIMRDRKEGEAMATHGDKGVNSIDRANLRAEQKAEKASTRGRDRKNRRRLDQVKEIASEIANKILDEQGRDPKEVADEIRDRVEDLGIYLDRIETDQP